MTDQSWLTTGEAARLLGVSPERARQWAATGRLHGRLADDGTWCLDPTSVEQELRRIQRASWWRRDGLSRDQANEARRTSTRRLFEAAVAWRESPDDPRHPPRPPSRHRRPPSPRSRRPTPTPTRRPHQQRHHQRDHPPRHRRPATDHNIYCHQPAEGRRHRPARLTGNPQAPEGRPGTPRPCWSCGTQALELSSWAGSTFT